MKLKWLRRQRSTSSKSRLDNKRQETKMGVSSSSLGIEVSDSSSSWSQQQRVSPVDNLTLTRSRQEEEEMDFETASETAEIEDLSVSFGYQCRQQVMPSDEDASNVSSRSRSSESSQDEAPSMTIKLLAKKSSSFSCLSGAALSANATLANTALGNGFIGEEILPGLDSPRTFRKLVSSSSTTRLELSRHSGLDDSTSPSTSQLPTSPLSWRAGQSRSAPNRIESASFLNATDIQTAGGAAGEDRVQAVCSEENGWLFCGIYDGFNGRDAADFLAGTYYKSVGIHLRLLECHVQQREHESRVPFANEHPYALEGFDSHHGLVSKKIPEDEEVPVSEALDDCELKLDQMFQHGVMQGLERALAQTESEFLEMVEQEMEERPELVMVGSCVLTVLLHGLDLYTLNVGDSRAVLATTHPPENSIACDRIDGSGLWAVQMTESHVVDNVDENKRVLSEHPDDPGAISGGRLKGKLKVTRAFGAGYLKDPKLNNALMGILRVRNLFSPPYLGVAPCVSAHRISQEDSFVVLGSDGLFDFFTNDEVVKLVHNFVTENPTGAPAKYMLEELLLRAAENAGMTVDQLKGIPAERRRKYHDDVTIIVISLGAQFPTSTASTVSAVGGD